MFSKSREFFQLPPTTKSLYCRNASEDTTSPNVNFSEKDMMSCYPNGIFPSEKTVPGFYSAVESYKTALNSVARFVFEQLATALQLPNQEFLSYHQNSLGGVAEIGSKAHLSFLYYGNICGEELIMDTHTDFASMTLLVSTATGFQVRMVDVDGLETWINADPVQGSIFLHVGDLMERWTCGVYKATVHRVKKIGTKSEGRQTIPYFIHPDSNVIVRPLLPERGLTECYPPISAGDYWKLKVNKETALQSIL